MRALHLLTFTSAENNDGRSLLTSSYEIGYLILYVWAIIPDWDIFGRFFEIVINGFDTPHLKDPWCNAAKSYLSEAAHADEFLLKCVCCLRVPEVPGALGLAGLLQFIQYMMDNFPLSSTCPDMSWISLLLAVSCACAREYCHSLQEEDELNYNRTIIPRGIEIVQCVV